MFDNLQNRDIISWNALIAAHSNHGSGREALKLFGEIRIQGLEPDRITFINALSACTNPGHLIEGKALHTWIVDAGFQSDVVVGNTLVNMYGSCGALDDALSIFEKMQRRDVISWSVMIGVCSQNDHAKDALRLFQGMRQQGVKPNRITFLNALSACAVPEALGDGKAIHASICDNRLESDDAVASALINMYGKCGDLVEARTVFEKMHQRDVISWSTMITSYSHHGYGKEALEHFLQMRQEGLKPNDIIFVSLLSACSHSGLLDEGQFFFASMTNDYGISPMLEHYNCMIDLLGRAGRLDEAEDMIHEMPCKPDAQVWTTLLGACRVHGDVERAERAAKHLFGFDPHNAGAYVVLSNMYAECNRLDSVDKIKKTMVKWGVRKLPGCSWIEIGT